ncbi:IS66 family transposase [Lacticaseibacillus jixiensis]|uniref:IS66 family transposase n=1 Tax=Lacticaseibacillus jixiensis TaxID=3231926 RepID=UPI0036F3FDEB
MGAVTTTIDEHAEVIALRQKVSELEEQIAWFKKQVFGQKSEHSGTPDLSKYEQLALFAEEYAKTEAALKAAETVTHVKAHDRKKAKKLSEKISPDVECVEETIDITPEQRVCAPGWKLVPVGRREARTTIEYIPAKLKKTVYYVRTYKKVRSDGEAEPEFLQAHLPNAVIIRSVVTPSLLAKVIHDKYELDVPLYRQLNEWKRLGLTVSETTLSNWMIESAELMAPIYDRIHECLVRQPFLQGDETPTQVLKEANRKATDQSYMWVARTVRKSPTPMVYFKYDPHRSQAVAKALYAGFNGVLQCDGYAGYNGLTIERVGCMAHVRRKFVEASQVAKTKDYCVPLQLLDQMFHLENEWRALSPKARCRRRRSKLKPLLNRFWAWCDKNDALPKSSLGKAVSYAENMRPYIDRLLKYGEIDLSNNASERNMKSYVMGRKNFLFSTSPDGARANAILMSIIETCKANAIDPTTYLTEVLNEMAQYPENRKFEFLGQYLPWNWHQES